MRRRGRRHESDDRAAEAAPVMHAPPAPPVCVAGPKTDRAAGYLEGPPSAWGGIKFAIVRTEAYSPKHCACRARIFRNKLYASNELRALETQLVRIAYFGREYEVFPAPNSMRSLHRVGDYPRPAQATVSAGPGVILGGVATVDQETANRLLISDRLDRLSPRVVSDESTTEQGEPGALPTGNGSSVPLLTYYDVGRRSLGRLYDYEVASRAPALQQVEAVIRIADWDLLHSRNTLALEGYEQVYAWLMEADARATIEALFSPRTPFVLPTFAVNPLASEAIAHSTGYIDVAFAITKFGEPRRIEILDTSTNATEAAKKRLVTLITGCRFRPRVVDNELGHATRVEVRYYLPASPKDSAFDPAQ